MVLIPYISNGINKAWFPVNSKITHNHIVLNIIQQVWFSS